MKKVIKLSSNLTIVLIALFVYTSAIRMVVQMMMDMGLKSIALLPVWAFIGFLIYVSGSLLINKIKS
tara:strand:+ start:374 stop:574 length:201 start_codon:yes stop_codon:yes gene_type:complete